MLICEDSLEDAVPEVRRGDIIFLYGDLWAGKTTLTRALLRKLWLPESVTVRSPTYTYMQEYEVNIDGIPTKLYHFDLYRVEDYEIFVNIGAEEIFEDAQSIKIVEWPEKIESHYQANTSIQINKVEDLTLRDITITQHD